MSVISIDIGSSRIAAVQGTVTGNTIEITAADTAPLRRGSIVDNLIRNPEEVAATITNLLDKNRALNAKKAIITISPGNALVREFTVPAGNARQLEAMIRSEMLNYNTASTTDVIEYKLLENTVDVAGAKTMLVRAMSMSQNIVENYYNALQRVKLQPLAMDVHSNAIEKLLSRRPLLNGIDQSDNCIILLDFSYSGTMAYIVYNYSIFASRFIPIGLGDFEQSILSTRYDIADTDNYPLDVKHYLDFRKESAADPNIMRYAEATLLQCCNEVQKLIIYSTSRLPKNTIACTLLTGDGCKLLGVDSVFSSELNTPVMPLDTVGGIKFSNILAEKELPYYLNAISALIRL